MAKMTFRDGMVTAEKMEGKTREMIKRIVMAGASEAERILKESTQKKDHVRNSDMLNSIGPGKYHEFFQGGSVGVYPQGEDRRGVRNATKAYVINYGRGGTRKRTGKMGDRFITREEKQIEEAVRLAMQAESDRIMKELEE